MRRILLFLVIASFGVFAAALPRPASALDDWPRLLSCPDVTATGAVGGGDIASVVLKFGTTYFGSPEQYSLLFDVDGGGAVGGSDIATVVLAFGHICPQIDTQVAQATKAIMQYQDCQNAVTDGYGPSSGGVYVPDMGIHISRLGYMSSTFDLEKPFGLVCSQKAGAPAGTPGRLIGAWYIIPVASTCSLYGLGGQCQDSSLQPDGFGDSNIDEDNQNPPGRQDGWHTHINLCVGPGSLNEMGLPNTDWHQHANVDVQDLDPDHECVAHRGGSFNVPIYGWMLHLYNFVPNPEGRFMKWNVNPDLP